MMQKENPRVEANRVQTMSLRVDFSFSHCATRISQTRMLESGSKKETYKRVNDRQWGLRRAKVDGKTHENNLEFQTKPSRLRVPGKSSQT